VFGSFFFAGFECSTGINMHGEWFDQIAATGHDQHVAKDYGLLAHMGFRAAREGIRWPLVDRHGRYDFSSLLPFIEAARDNHVEVVWDLFHYGYPSDIDLLGDGFAGRFAEYCHAVARFITAHSEGPWYFTPMNEPSYFSWAAGEVGRFAPHLHGQGQTLKRALLRAAIGGINAIRRVAPQARMVNVDPLCRAVPPIDRPDMAAGAENFNQYAVYESWDMLCGRVMPEFGGSREHLDIIGINYYSTNQWEIGREEQPLADDDPRWLPLRVLIEQVWRRYGGDVLISETSDVGDRRAAWVDYIAGEACALQQRGVPLSGVCLYPILGMPEWHCRERWTRMGLWDVLHEQGLSHRALHEPMQQALRRVHPNMA
jgi:hypothetical protein